MFDSEGNFLKQWTNAGAPWAICITPGPKQVLYTSDSNAGRIYKLGLDGNILGAFGKFGRAFELARPKTHFAANAEVGGIITT